LIDQILSPRNLQRALRQVIANEGSAGVDGMKTSQLAMFFRKQRTLILHEIRDHKYLPQPIMGVEIPKGQGKLDF
jgi:retron-type reverse transcriptase